METIYSYADKLFIQLAKLTLGKIPTEDYMRLWRWIDGRWTKAGSDETKKLEAITKAINNANERFPHRDLLKAIKIE